MHTTASIVAAVALAGAPPAPPGMARLPRKGLVGYWAGEGSANDSAGRNHGRIVGAVTFVRGKVGRCFKLDGRGAHVQIASSPALRITGDQSVAMWLCADTIQKHMNPFHKAYGGEFSVLLREGGYLRYAFGMSGSNGRPWAALVARDAVEMLKARRWVHFAAVRDVTAKTVRLYVNGRKARNLYGVIYLPGQPGRPHTGDITALPKARASSYPAYIGRGNNECFAGLIDEVALWNRALSHAEIALVAGSGPGVPHLTRAAAADRVVTTKGSVLLGEIRNAQFTVATSFGKVTVPARRVVGLVTGAASKVPATAPAGEAAAPRLVLVDGQVLVGKLAEPAVEIRIAGGSTLRVPWGKVREFAYRVSEARPSAPAPTGTMVSLAGGERLALAGTGPELQLLTVHGRVPLAVSGLRSVEATGKADRPHRACFVNGSELSGTLLPARLALEFRLGPRTTVGRDAVRRIDRAVEPVAPTGAATVELRSGDCLFGTMGDERLTLRIVGGDVVVRPAGVRTIAPDPAKPGQVAVTIWNGSVLRGRLGESAVTFAITPGGPTVKLKVAEIAALARSTVDPPEAVVRKVLALIAQLGAASYKDREAATKALVALGPGIASLLKRHRESPDPEVRARIERILSDLAPTTAAPPARPAAPQHRAIRLRAVAHATVGARRLALEAE